MVISCNQMKELMLSFKTLAKYSLIILLAIAILFWNMSSIQHIENNYDPVVLHNTQTIVAKYKIEPHVAYYVADTIKTASESTGISSKLLLGIIATESSFKVQAINTQSGEGAKGLMQIHKTSGLMPAEPLDIEQNIFTGSSILKSFVDKYGVARGIEAYNAGNRKRNPEYYQRVRLNSEGFI